MQIKYLGHSAFLIKTEDFSVCFDPFCDIGYDIEPVTCDYCVCSHGHFDHAAYRAVKYKYLITGKNKKAIDENKNCVAEKAETFADKKGVFKRVQIYHDDKCGALRGENYATVFESGGVVFCHLGDAGENYADDIAQKIGKIDVLLIPVGGRYTIDARQAKRYVLGLNPEIVIPMHYKTRKSSLDISDKNEFLKLFCDKSIKNVTSPFEISVKDLPKELTVFNVDDREF